MVKNTHKKLVEKPKRTLSKDHKSKIAEAHKGKKHSQESKDKISAKNKGKTAWNKGLSNPNATKNLGKYAKGLKGAEHPNWKGGLIKVNGYYYVWNEELGRHFGGKYVKRADFVWFEKYGEIIKEPYFLHHKDENKENDNIINLRKLKRGSHSIITNMLLMRDKNGRFCKK